MSILKIHKLTKRFGGIHALDSCSISIERGKITAIIGPNGSGKTTLFNMISGLIKPDSGQILLDQNDITMMNAYTIAQLGLSRTFQEVALFKNLTIREHLQISMDNDRGIMQSIFCGTRNEMKIKDILKTVGLNKELSTLAGDLSYGQRKLLDLACALSKKHSIIMLDEPVAGVNPNLRHKIKMILRELKNNGETIIIIEHDMNFVMDISDRIFVLDAGKVIANGPPKKIQKDKKVLNAYLGD